MATEGRQQLEVHMYVYIYYTYTILQYIHIYIYVGKFARPMCFNWKLRRFNYNTKAAWKETEII